MTAGLAVAAVASAVLAVAAPQGSAGGGGTGSGPPRDRRPTRLVSAPVRIADPAVVRLLRPGDRVDVLAATGPQDARTVARGARVAAIPGQGAPGASGAAATPQFPPEATASAAATDPVAGYGEVVPEALTDLPGAPESGGLLSGQVEDGGGALVVLAVPRRTARALAGASITSRLAVTLC